MSRLLAATAAVLAVIGGATAIALAARGGGPVPKRKGLAPAIHQALAAKPIKGITASINFTNNLIDTSEIQGSDPLLTGGPGQIWASADGLLRVELYNNNGGSGDPEIVVNHRSWWVYDPTLNTVYEGTLPAQSKNSGTAKSAKHEALPTVAQIQAQLQKLAAHLHLSGAIPSDVGDQAAYTVKISPKHDAGLLGQLQLAWDAYRGVPLRFGVYRRGDTTPVLEVAATGVKYSVDPSVFDIHPPSSTGPNAPHVVKVATPAATSGDGQSAEKGKGMGKHKQTQVTGVKAVASHVSFGLVAPSRLVGLPRQSVSLLDMGKQHGALITYGQNLGGIAVIEEPASANSTQKVNLTSGSGDHARGITLPAVRISSTVTGQELDTALGTIVRFTSGNVTYTVMGSVPPYAADRAARAL